jgi:tetratricopeptide (TPR) repeat protein
VGVGLSTYGLYCTGEYVECLAICDRAIGLADADTKEGSGLTGGSTYAWLHVQKGGALAILGELDEAHRFVEQGRRIARQQSDIEMVGFCHQWACVVDYFRGDAAAAFAHAQQSAEIAARIGSPFSRSWSSLALGWAEHMRGQWRPGITALERSREIAREHRTTAEADALRLALLGECYLGIGDADRAIALVEEAIAVDEVPQNLNAVYARLALARVLLGSVGVAARDRIEAALDLAGEVSRATGAKAYEPQVLVERAALAAALGDGEGSQRSLREAHRLFVEVGATGYAERLAVTLGLLPAS